MIYFVSQNHGERAGRHTDDGMGVKAIINMRIWERNGNKLVTTLPEGVSLPFGVWVSEEEGTPYMALQKATPAELHSHPKGHLPKECQANHQI